MDSLIIDAQLSNSALWEEVIYELRSKTLGADDSKIPIPDFWLPMADRPRIIAARCYNPFARKWWYRGCWIKQLVPMPSLMDGHLEIANFMVPLYHRGGSELGKIIFLSEVSTSWQLRAAIPQWHETIELQIWKFTGDLTAEVTRQLQFLRERQINQTSKLDEILLRLP